MIRIGLITWYGSKNYGTNLQVFALQKAVTNLGYSYDLILPFHFNAFGKKDFLKRVLSLTGIMKLVLWLRAKRDIKRRKILKFIWNDLSTRGVYCRAQYRKLLNDYSVFMTGSDQIWNPYHVKGFYFLDFAGMNKRVAYASSIGVTELPEEKKSLYKTELSKFSSIGVREESARKLLVDLLGRNDVQQVLDPTFLLTPDEWKTFASSADVEIELPDEYILCYLIGNRESYSRQLQDVQRKTGIKHTIIIQSAENADFSLKDAICYDSAGPKEFVRLLQSAKLVCTDSFHATAISINMSIDFVEFLRFDDNDVKSQNSRIYDLLGHYQLSDRFYAADGSKWAEPIDFTQSQSILERDRENSIHFLVNAIEN